MEISAASRVVLELLVGENKLTTAEAWEKALRTRLPCPQDDSANEPAASSRLAWITSVVEAVDVIVPHLADYKTFDENVCGLLKFCEHECAATLFNIICKWLAASPASTAFRHWLYGYADHITDTIVVVDVGHWKQALLTAALQEQDGQLKITILKVIDQQIGSLEGVVDPRRPSQSQLIRLLVFYWEHAEKLIRSSTLCAAKVVAMTHDAITPSEEIVAILRWGQLIKPLFFENFVGDLLRLQALRRLAELELQVPTMIESWFCKATSLRLQVQSHLEASQQQMKAAAQRKVQYLYRAGGSSAEWVKLCITTIDDLDLAVEVISYLRHDLAVLPTNVFSPAFVALAMVSASVLQGDSATEVTSLTTDSLLSLLMLRTDASSLLLILTTMIDLQIASLPVWRNDTACFRRSIEQLSEAMILEIDGSKKWVLQTALHHLLLECDDAILLAHAAFLRERLPHNTYTLARVRMTDQNQ